MRRGLRWLLAALLTLGVLYGAFVGYVSWRSAESLVHPARPASSWTPADAGLAFEPLALTTSDGVALAGWWMPADEARGTVVFLHGYGDSKNQSLAYAPFLLRAGYHVLAFDFRAHGASGGSFTTVGLD
ncbi:MAG TPA: alpha/beta fold hydrolase, partial [Candidatus Thermoplasmatota archaeon]|nr:alpha/beta fold hydrolase [Candidatus Thermoplasmatota archaeon]